jgi:hypothetical protein
VVSDVFAGLECDPDVGADPTEAGVAHQDAEWPGLPPVVRTTSDLLDPETGESVSPEDAARQLAASLEGVRSVPYRGNASADQGRRDPLGV